MENLLNAVKFKHTRIHVGDYSVNSRRNWLRQPSEHCANVLCPKMYVGGFVGWWGPSLSRSRNCILPTRNCATQFCPTRRDHFSLSPRWTRDQCACFCNVLNPFRSVSDLTVCVPTMSAVTYSYITFTEGVIIRYYCLNTYAKWRFSYSFLGYFPGTK